MRSVGRMEVHDVRIICGLQVETRKLPTHNSVNDAGIMSQCIGLVPASFSFFRANIKL